MEKFEKAPEAEIQGFESEKALHEEESLIGRFRDGKAGKLARALALISALSFAPGILAETYAGEGGAEAKIERQEKSHEEKVIEFLSQLYNLPDSPKAEDQSQNKWSKEEAARLLIKIYALERKTAGTRIGDEKNYTVHREGHVSLHDTMDALNELNDSIGLFADRMFGDKDGVIEGEDIKKLNDARQGNPGFDALIDMTKEYRQLFGYVEKLNASPKDSKAGTEAGVAEKNEVSVLAKLYNASDEEGARKVLMDYIFEKTGGSEKAAPMKEVGKILGGLDKASGLFADQALGNKDGKADIEEMNRLNSILKDNIGFQVLIDMIAEHQALERESTKS